MKRVAVYCRVSTKGRCQTVETQLLPLRQYCGARSLEIVGEFCDTGVSGSQDRRPQLDRLMKDARARRFDAVLVYKFDRFGRSVSHLIRALEEFRALGVDFVSLTESVDTSTPAGKLMFSMLTAFAEFERALIVERIHSGLDRARKQGKRLGRPKAILDRERVHALRQGGATMRSIASELGVSVGKIYDTLAA